MIDYTKQHLSGGRFELVLNYLLEDIEFRKAFFNEPVDALKKIGISLTPEESITIKNFIRANVSNKIVNFNEKLVLCSSSGY